MFPTDYIADLKKRSKESHVYRSYQLFGLEIAKILNDEKHKALYIKLAKTKNGNELLKIAREVAENKTVKNMGAYFMRIVTQKPKKNGPKNLNHKQ